MLSRIYLIRHGKTDGNRNHWYYGATDLPLTEEGAAEIRAHAEHGIYPAIPDDADIYTTGLIRTDQTLEAIYGKRDHTALPKLQEINFGKAECMTYDELKQFDNFQKWAWDTTGDERIADAETSNEFHARIHEGLKELLARHRLKEWSHRHGGQDAVSVIVCHGGVVACIMEKLFPAVCGSMWDWLPEPGFGYAVDFRDGDPYMYSKINDIGRLGLGLYRLPLRGSKAKTYTADRDGKQQGGRSRIRQIDHKAVRALIDSQMSRGHGYFELEFAAWPEAAGEDGAAANSNGSGSVGAAANSSAGSVGSAAPEEPDTSRKIRAVREALTRRYDRSRYHLAALVEASMLAEAEALIRKTGAGYLDRLAMCGIEKYYEDYPEDADIEPETLADKRIDGPEEDSGRPVSADLTTVWKELQRLKEKGLVKKAGLAFSGSATLLDDLLKDRQEIDYVELPVNYSMGFSEGDLAQKYYTISRRRYKEILVRSPFAGGELARIGADELPGGAVPAPGEQDPAGGVATDGDTVNKGSAVSDPAKDTEVLRKTMAGYALLKQEEEPVSAVDWALRYVLSFPFVVTCVASTCDPDHAAEDMDAADRFRPLTEGQREKLKKAFAGRSSSE